MRIIIKEGDKYNKLTAVKFSHRNNHGNQYWIFQCDCGNEKLISVSAVKKNSIKSCGCLNKTHGMSYTQIYKTWETIKQRCLNKNYHNYKNYGGRGITICQCWLNFANFYKDMGNKPNGKSLDRKDNSKGYCKLNCRWATREEQNNNKRTNVLLTYKNRTQTIAEWAREFDVRYNLMYSRLRKGWSIERATKV